MDTDRHNVPSDRTFTEYVQIALEDEPSLEQLDQVFRKLGDALKHEMKRRGLWSAPPSYLGISGWDSWNKEEAFEELLADCYLFNFVKRLTGLGALLLGQDNIEGVIFRNIRQFLFEKQRRHDPLGYRVFSVLRQAVRRSLDLGELWILDAGPPIDNRTLLGWSRVPDASPAREEQLTESVQYWTDLLLPELVTSREPRLSLVISDLCGHLRELGRQVESVCFKDLIDPFKRSVRRRWSALWAETQGETAAEDDGDGLTHWVRTIRPRNSFEERDRFEGLLRCVSGSLDRLKTDSKTRGYLGRLWFFTRDRVTEPDAAPMPSRRRVAEMLNIPRHRLSVLYDLLAGLLGRCRDDAFIPSPQPPGAAS